MYSSVMKTALSHVNESKILLDHIAENSLVLLKNDFARVRLTLNPPQLGILDMNMHMNKDRIKLVLTAETTEVKQILQTNLEQLKNTLQEQGINIDRLDVLVQDHGGKDEQSGRGAKAYQQQSTSEMHDDAVSTKESNNVYTHEIELNMFRGDETISVFA
jgi:flagellar hook-length control protein FliK